MSVRKKEGGAFSGQLVLQNSSFGLPRPPLEGRRLLRMWPHPPTALGCIQGVLLDLRADEGGGSSLFAICVIHHHPQLSRVSFSGTLSDIQLLQIVLIYLKALQNLYSIYFKDLKSLRPHGMSESLMFVFQ